MYTIKVDGQEIYSPALSDDPCQIISPRLQLEVNAPGSLSFTVPPGHAAHDIIHKMKSIVTMEQDGEEIFRGRAVEEKTDIYNQKEIYCEGDLSFLLDSIQRPFTYSGTVAALFQQLLDAHNTQVEPEKRFALGSTAALTDADVLEELQSEGYADTLNAMRSILSEKEGYLRTRYEGGVHYLDFITSFGGNNGQTIEFGVNLVDLDNQTAAGDICTVMLPIGGMLEDGTTVTIASVNGGSDTIENPDAIALYGRIVKPYTFDLITDPAELLEQAQKKLNDMTTAQTLTLKAVDMHMINAEHDKIRLGTPVKIKALPHGMDKEEVCSAIDLDPESPEKTVYTFGKPERTQSGATAMMTNMIRTHTSTIMQQLKHYKETDYKVQIQAGLLESHDEYLAQAKIELDGINAKIELKAEKKNVEDLEGRLYTAESVILQQAALIDLKASVYYVDLRHNEASVRIDALNSQITLKADLILLDGYVKATDLEAEVLSVMSNADVQGSLWVESTLNAYTVQATDLYTATINDLDAYDLATQTWVEGKGYLTSSSLTPYATQAWVMGNFVRKE